jgi:DNA-binding beta-propeller fold protein YncE
MHHRALLNRFLASVFLPALAAWVGTAAADGVEKPAGAVTLKPKVIATFDASTGENPEGIVIPFAGDEEDNLFVTYLFRAEVHRVVNGAGEPVPYATISDPTNRVGAGLATDDSGNIYWAIGALPGPGTAPPGLYRIPAGGGVAEWFSVGHPAAFANGIEIVGNTAYWTDPVMGAVHATDLSTGASQFWSLDPSLAGDPGACGGSPLPFPFGANGITHSRGAIYVTNTQHGRVVRIPIRKDGSAGTARVITASCSKLKGADGIAASGQRLYVVNQESNSVLGVDANTGRMRTVFTGTPLDRPSSIIVARPDCQKRLFVTNLAQIPGGAGASVVAFKVKHAAKHNDD